MRNYEQKRTQMSTKGGQAKQAKLNIEKLRNRGVLVIIVGCHIGRQII